MTDRPTADEATLVEGQYPASADRSSVTRDAASAATDELDEGTMVGRYIVIEQLGKGAMGVVFRAYDPKLRREIALKVMRSSPGLGGPEAQARMLREAQALARLSHPNVVAVYDAESTEHGVCIAMEYVEGRTLRLWLREESRRWPVVLAAVLAATQGLAAAHTAGVVHRDVKPANVLVGNDGRVRLTDFGLARERHRDVPASTGASFCKPDDGLSRDSGDSLSQLTEEGTVLGTPAYMAPEQHEGGTADARSDQYALCVVLWEALYGQRPFERAKGALVQSKERAPPQRPASSVPEWLHAVIVRGLALEPDERWPSVDALVDALQRGQSRARWRGGLGFAGMLGISALAFGGWLQFDRQHRIAGCERAGESIEQVWNDEARDRLRTAFLGSGVSHAEVTAGKVMPWLDAQTRGWQTARIEVCLGAEVRGTWDIDVLDRGLWCLDERRMELEALVTELSRPEARNVEKAVQAVAELGQLESCQDVDLLRRTSTPPKERRDEIRVARAELSKAMALRRTGAYEEGLAVARDALSHAQTLEWPPLVAEAHNQLGVLLEFAGDYARAEETLEAGYFLATEAGAPGPALVAATRLVHTVGHRLAQHEQGFRWSRHAKATLVSVPDLAQMREADLLSNLANVHYSAGSYDEAQTLHERALAIRERALGPQHPRVASSLNNLASLHAVTGSYDQAKVLFERALTIWQETLGPEHPHVATTFSNLAGVHFSTGSYEKARTLNERALAIREKALRPDHPDIAASLNNLASVHHATGSWQEAKTLHERGLAIKERALGPEHPDVAMGLDNLARVHFSTGGYEDAKMLHQRALALREKALGPAHPHLAETLVGLGRVALAQRRASEAVSLARRAVGLREDGKSPPAQVAEARFVLAQALWEANEDRTRAVEVAELARDDYQDLGNTSQLAEVDAWLAEHGGAP